MEAGYANGGRRFWKTSPHPLRILLLSWHTHTQNNEAFCTALWWSGSAKQKEVQHHKDSWGWRAGSFCNIAGEISERRDQQVDTATGSPPRRTPLDIDIVEYCPHDMMFDRNREAVLRNPKRPEVWLEVADCVLIATRSANMWCFGWSFWNTEGFYCKQNMGSCSCRTMQTVVPLQIARKVSTLTASLFLCHLYFLVL